MKFNPLLTFSRDNGGMDTNKFLQSKAFQNLCTQFLDGVEELICSRDAQKRLCISDALEMYSRSFLEAHQAEVKPAELNEYERLQAKHNRDLDFLTKMCSTASGGKMNRFTFSLFISGFQKECKKALVEHTLLQPETQQRMEWFLDVRLKGIIADPDLELPDIDPDTYQKLRDLAVVHLSILEAEGVVSQHDKMLGEYFANYRQKSTDTAKTSQLTPEQISKIHEQIDVEYPIWKAQMCRKPDDLARMQRMIDELVGDTLVGNARQEFHRTIYAAFVAQVVVNYRVNHLIDGEFTEPEAREMAAERRNKAYAELTQFTAAAIDCGLSAAMAQDILRREVAQRAADK